MDRKRELFAQCDSHRTPGGRAFALAVLPGGHLLVAAAPGMKGDTGFPGRDAGDTTEVKLWDTKGKKEVVLRTGHNKRVTFVTFSASGRLLVTASEDQTVKVWRVS